MSDEKFIQKHYNTLAPSFAYICSGLRRIAVNPEDARARKMLLRRGVRYVDLVQLVIHGLLKNLPFDLFLDVGSNYGECAFSVPLYCPTKILGFEANPHLHSYLGRSKIYNDDVQDIAFRQVAVSNSAGTQQPFYIDEDWSGKSSLHQTTNQRLLRIDVPVTTIDNELQHLQLKPDLLLLKVDVEGAEPQVLDGASQTLAQTKNVVCLIEFDPSYVSKGKIDPHDFFESLLKQFQIHELAESPRRVQHIDDLRRTLGSRETRLHTDLLLSRFDDSTLATLFNEHILERKIEALYKGNRKEVATE